MKKIILVAVILLAIDRIATAQKKVTIGTVSTDTTALLEVNANNKGVLVPRITNAQMISIASPANGLLVYNTDSSAFAYRNATAWVFIKGNATASNDWSIKGNAGTDPAKNFIGTTDTMGLRFRIKNTNAGTLDSLTRNTAFGFRVLDSASTSIPGQFNTAFGYKVLLNNNAGRNNTGIGANALQQARSGSSNVAIGNSAMGFNNTGNYNVAAGDKALFSHTAGDDNVAVGYFSLANDSIGTANTAVGANSLFSNISGESNAAFGANALLSNTVGVSNVAVGNAALFSNINRSNLVAIGDSALYNNGTDIHNDIDAKYNIAVGSKAMYSNSVGYGNTAVGFEALKSNTNGNSNTAIGSYSMHVSNYGYSNSAFGANTLAANNGYENSAVGANALFNNTAGNYNTAIGGEAMFLSPSGDNNTAVGVKAGYHNVGSGNIFIGHKSGYNETGSNKLYISNYESDSANTLIYGEFDNQLLRSNGRMEINSDNTLNDGLRVIKNYAAGTNKNISAVYGENAVDDSWGIGLEGKGGRTGVQGLSQGTGINRTYTGINGIADGSNQSTNLGVWGQASGSALTNKGVTGQASGSGSDNYGLYGVATGGGNTNYGVYGMASGAVLNYAGYFNGNVLINGNLDLNATAIKVSGTNPSVFTVTATAALLDLVIPNTSMANSATDILIVTHNLNGTKGMAPGVYWNGTNWLIFLESGAPHVVGEKFNVMVIKQ